MKTSRNLLALAFSVLAAGVLALRAQQTATLNQSAIIPSSPASLAFLEAYSDAQLDQLVKALAAMPLIWPASLPDDCLEGYNGIGYWSLAHPEWPPLPGAFGTPFWDLTPDSASSRSFSFPASASGSRSGFFLLDDVDFPPFPGGEGGTNVYTPSFQPMALPTTNDLWLQVAGTTNPGTGITADLIIHPPWHLTDGVWDIFAATNLASSAWQWVFRSAPGQTNVTLTGLAYPNEFFRAASTNDTDGDSLSDAFEKWASHTNPNLYSTDGTGMSDGWEWQNFGSISNNPAGDPDGDQLSTFQEWQMYSQGYNPTKWNSATNSVVGDGFLDFSGDGLANLMAASFGGNLMTNDLTWKVNTSGDGLPDEYKTMVGLSPGSAQPAPTLPAYGKNPIQ